MIANFLAWMVRPNDRSYARNLMLFVSSELRTQALRDNPKLRNQAFNWALLQFSDKYAWLGEAFERLGGEDALRNTPSRRSLRAFSKQYVSEARDVACSVWMMHLHAGEMGGPALWQPSAKRAHIAARLVSPIQSKPNTILKHWTQHRASAAFIYASSVTMADKNSVLEHLLRTPLPNPRLIKSCLPELLSRARYIDEEILSRLRTRKIDAPIRRFRYDDSVTLLPFVPVTPASPQREMILSALSGSSPAV